MNNNNSRLIIIPYYLDELSIDSIRNSTCDILALSLPVIQQLDSEKIIYFTLGNFINQKDFDTHLSKLTKSLTDFLKINDSLSKDQFSLERLFSSNGFWFLHRLSHLSFLQMLIDSLENKYDQIEIYLRKNNHSKKDISINFHSLNFPINNLCGLDGIVESLNIGLKNKIVNKINILETTKNLNSLNQPVMQLLKRLPEITLRKIKEKFEKLVCSLSLRKKLFWTTFISYDVDRLKNKKYSWNFKPIMKTQSLLANDCVAEDTTELRERIYPLSNDFIMKWIPSFSNKFQAIIDGYVENIISRIPNVRLSIQKEIEKHNPKAIFFSTGIQNILQANIAQIAYKKKIPVYSFKHTGIEHLFFKSQYIDSYYDYDIYTRRTQFLHNKFELDVFNNSKNVNAIISGNLKQRHSSSKTKTAKPKKILYSVGQPDHSSFHFYHCLLNDFDRHLWTKNLLKSIQRNDLSLDVKLHPVEWTVYQEYFNKLLMQEKFNKINLEIIIGGSIERILKNYNLLVLDMVPSQVLSAALSMGMNIILFKQPSNFINKDTYADLINRVYVASNVDELDHLLKLFREKKLKNKSSIEFDEKYLSWNSEIIDILDQAKF